MKNLDDILELYRNKMVQIATPYSTGTGFHLATHDLIVTNEHVVRGNRCVVIFSELFPKQLVDVKFVDPGLDLAFLAAPTVESNQLPIQLKTPLEGDEVVAAGHPFGLDFKGVNGKICEIGLNPNEVMYLHHDASLSPGNSGGPLINSRAELIGVNTFIIQNGKHVGFSLPSTYLIEAITEFFQSEAKVAARCTGCTNLVKDDEAKGGYCPHCGIKVDLPSQVEDYIPIGIGKTIEEILMRLGHDVTLSRIGPNLWQVIEGSAQVYLTYHEESGLIIGDSYLAKLPKENIGTIYEFLLRENHRQETIAFSVKGRDIILSLIIYDRYLNVETGELLMKRLFKMSDHYDNILVEKYGAQWGDNLNH